MNINRKSKNVMMIPHIEVKPMAINMYNDNLEYDSETNCLYHVVVSQGQLKMMFLVAQRPITETNHREFDVVRCEYISLHGINERDQYLGQVNNLSISADKTIVNEIFSSTLEPYCIKMLNITFHNFEFFEAEEEGKGFIFENKEVYDKLKDRINKVCVKMLRNPYIIEY